MPHTNLKLRTVITEMRKNVNGDDSEAQLMQNLARISERKDGKDLMTAAPARADPNLHDTHEARSREKSMQVGWSITEAYSRLTICVDHCLFTVSAIGNAVSFVNVTATAQCCGQGPRTRNVCVR